MKLTIEGDRERIKRFSHIKPAPTRGPARCSAKCPGTMRICTLKYSHPGPHVAHGRFKRVVAVWDEGIKDRKPEEKQRRAVVPIARKTPKSGGIGAALKAFRSLVVRREHFIEEAILLVFAVSMVWFALDMAFHVLGWR